MLTSSGEGGVVPAGRRGLHAGLIKAPPPSRRSPATGVTSSSLATPQCPPRPIRDDTVIWRHTNKQSDRGRERRRETWHRMEEYHLDAMSAARTPVVKGIRAVSIMDTLSQLAGQEAIQASRRLRAPASLPPPAATSSTSPASRTRGRTPDWIKRIFEFAKRGQLEQLRSSLRDMEATLVRNLSDHHGNNLVHVLAAQGHANALAWLCAALQGAQLEGALNDENRSGLTPAACAVKYGHTSCVEWLVSNTRLRDKLSTRDGERCLLHTAAKYNQESVVRWLVHTMRSRHLSLDQRDHAGDTPLHLAARAGGLEPCRLLLANGADVTLKNDAGVKASDVAYAAGHVAVQHFLNLFEASLGVAGELSRTQTSLDSLQADNAELRGYFRDVLSVGKRLAKERDEMCRDALGRLHKMAGLAAHDKMAAELAELAEENRVLRERLGLVQAASVTSDPLRAIPSPGSVSRIGGGSESGWRGLLVGGLADMEHRLLLAEEGWRRLLQRAPPATSSTSYSASEKRPLDILQHHVEQIEQQQNSSSTVHLSLDEARSLSSSESSLDTLLSLRSGADNIYSQLLDCTSPTSSQHSTPKPPPPPSKKRENKEEMRRRLRELSLTSESGNASVLEVIEPTTSEEDEDLSKIGEQMPFLATSSPRLKALSMSLEDELEKIDGPSSHRRYSSVQDLLDCEEIVLNESVAVPPPPEPLNQPDLLMGTASMDETGDEEIVSSDSPQNTTPTPQQSKKRTFLQKFSLKASWPSSKRKVSKSSKRIHEISADDFKETYMSQRNILGDASPCSTSSASQQELSSEEVASSGGAATRTASSGSSTSGSEGSGQKSDRTATGQTRATIETVPSKSNTPTVVEDIEIDEVEENNTNTQEDSTISSTVVDTSVEQSSSQEEPPPPVRLIPNSPRHLVKTSLADMKSAGQLQHHIESMSVTTSEDSGIVARPSSSASKSDSLLSSRPDSSSSSSFKVGLFPLRLSTNELMNASSASGRISPAPSDMSKPDSTRLGKIDEARLCENQEDKKMKPAIRAKPDKLKKMSMNLSMMTSKVETLTVENVTSETKVEVVDPNSSLNNEVPRKQSRSERAWYDLSDEEPDLLSSAALIRVQTRTSSDEEVNS